MAAASIQTVTLRPVTPSDVPVVRELVIAVLAEHGLRPDPQGMDADLDSPVDYAASGGHFDVLTDGDGQVVGTVAVWRIDALTAELRKMYFLPAIRGTGLGKQLLAFVLRRTRDEGYQQMQLETASSMRAAIGLYERFGFVPRKRARESERCDRAFGLSLASWQAPAGLDGRGLEIAPGSRAVSP